MKILFLALALTTCTTPVWAKSYGPPSGNLSVPNATVGTTYYIDGTNGSDSNPGTLAAPFKTIGYATGRYSGRIVGGNVFKIFAGTYHETLDLANGSGASASVPVVIGPYGNGDVVIDGTKTTGLTWNVYNSNIYRATNTLAINGSIVPPVALIMNDNFKSCRQVWSLAQVSAFGNWYYDGTYIYVYTGGLAPSSQNILVTALDQNNLNPGTIYVETPYITLYGLTIEGGANFNIWSVASNTVVQACILKYAGKQGFTTNTTASLISSHVFGNMLMNWPRGHTWNYSGGWTPTINLSDGYVGGNLIENNGGEGIIIGPGGSVVIEDNNFHDNWSVNIYMDGSSNSIVRRNLVYTTPITNGYADITTSDDPTIGGPISYVSCPIATTTGICTNSVCSNGQSCWDSWPDVQGKLERRLYPVGIAQAVESGEGAVVMNNILIYDNISIGNYSGIGMDCEASGSAFTNSTWANNTIVMPTDTPPTGFSWNGISIPHCSGLNSGNVIKNNIVYNTNATSYAVSLEAGSSESGVGLDYNLYFNPNTTTQFTAYNYPNITTYSLATWKSTMTGQDVHSISANPLFAGGVGMNDPAYYLLQASSPARGAGAAISGLTLDFNNYSFASTPAIGALEYVGASKTPAVRSGGVSMTRAGVPAIR